MNRNYVHDLRNQPSEHAQARQIRRLPIVTHSPEVDADQTFAHRRFRLPWYWLPLVLAIVIFGALLGVALSAKGESLPGGRLVAEHSNHDFGEQSISSGSSGELVTRFPVSVVGSPLVTDIVTTGTCTRARLVQAGQASEWFGGVHDAQIPVANMRLAPYQPAYLEVGLDPTTHGDASVGSIRQGAFVKTSDGQVLSFELAAQGVR